MSVKEALQQFQPPWHLNDAIRTAAISEADWRFIDTGGSDWRLTRPVERTGAPSVRQRHPVNGRRGKWGYPFYFTADEAPRTA
jgi:hypothetical protein